MARDCSYLLGNKYLFLHFSSSLLYFSKHWLSFRTNEGNSQCTHTKAEVQYGQDVVSDQDCTLHFQMGYNILSNSINVLKPMHNLFVKNRCIEILLSRRERYIIISIIIELNIVGLLLSISTKVFTDPKQEPYMLNFIEIPSYLKYIFI